MHLIIIPDGCSISPPLEAVRPMRSWDARALREDCDGEHSHDWKMRTGIGCLFVCRHCRASGWLTPFVAGRA